MDARPRSSGAPTGGAGTAAAGGARSASGGRANASGGTTNATGGASAVVADGGAADASTSRSLRVVVPEVAVPPGAEVFGCYHARVPSDADVHATAFISTAPSINELALYRVGADAKSGTLDSASCVVPGDGTWVYGAWSPDASLRMPPGVAHPLSARQPLLVDLHWLNGGAASATSSVVIELQIRDGTFQASAAAVSFNPSVSIPPGGMATVSGDCVLPAQAQLFSMTTHTNRLATSVSLSRKLSNGQLGEEFLRTTDYAHPSVTTWSTPPFPSLAAGEKLHYSCEYGNPGNSTITVGPSALANEMCMTISYFFPTSTAVRCN